MGRLFSRDLAARLSRAIPATTTAATAIAGNRHTVAVSAGVCVVVFGVVDRFEFVVRIWLEALREKQEATEVHQDSQQQRAVFARWR